MGKRVVVDWDLSRDGESWLWDELLQVLALYYVLPTGKHDQSNAQVQALARELHRKPGAVAMKLSNFRACDPNRPADRKGLSSASKLDHHLWDEIAAGAPIMDQAAEAAIALPADVLWPDAPTPVGLVFEDGRSGRDSVTLTRRRLGQDCFRNTQLDNYERRCALTGIAEPELLVASHVRPWAKLPDGPDRLAADNGILLNALHDKAFDQGLITIDKNLCVIVSSKVPHDPASEKYLWSMQGQRLRKPTVAPPRPEFIEFHNDVVFRR